MCVERWLLRGIAGLQYRLCGDFDGNATGFFTALQLVLLY